MAELTWRLLDGGLTCQEAAAKPAPSLARQHQATGGLIREA
jgi:hypothetical protein